jgi:pyridinium-3,5-biscarboxylic acid mononucleotide synthase
MQGELQQILGDVAAGRRSVDDAAATLGRMGYVGVGDFARLDVARAARAGTPEFIFAESKTADQLVAIVAACLEHNDSVLCSRVAAEQAAAVLERHPGAEYDARSRVLVARRPGAAPPAEKGAAGVLAAGTSDVAVAEEAAAVCRAMGVKVVSAYDVGVAGLHRLAGPLEELRAAGAAAIVVAAGMEGALPSVVAGLVDVPVIGLPTSTGYGLGGRGEAALLGMLQSCSPGLVVVNIDNGVGAGATAALIARRATG